MKNCRECGKETIFDSDTYIDLCESRGREIAVMCSFCSDECRDFHTVRSQIKHDGYLVPFIIRIMWKKYGSKFMEFIDKLIL